jgi:uncharacterized protein YlzI (FlbEa/FlbD family)
VRSQLSKRLIVVITLTNLGVGAGPTTPVEINESQISSIAVDPNEHTRTVVTLMNGTWFLVAESEDQINALIAEAKSGGN